MAETNTADALAIFTRYRPYIAIVAAIAALVLFLPGEGDDTDLSTGGGFASAPGGQTVVTGSDGSVVTTPGVPVTNADGSATGATIPSGTPTGAGGSGGPTSGGGGGGGGAGAPPPVPAGFGSDCDTATGRIKVPTRSAPPCVPQFSGDNGGNTYQGVTKDKIKVVYFQAESNPAVDGALTAAGANNRPEEQADTMKVYVDYFNAHYETYGRQVELIVRQGSGDAEDDTVGKSDALKIATEDKAFAVFGAPATNAFVDELANRGVICICTVSQPQDFYEKRDPYIGYTGLMASTQGYVHRAEYVGKRLAGKKAKYAGTIDGVSMADRQRTFGLLWYETDDGAYKAGVDFFVQELKNKYGVTLAESLSYKGYPDIPATQEGARIRIQRLKEAQVTSVVFSGDPVAPAIFTQEAKRQLYNPEWIITGSALTDTSLFARTYDQDQWSRAFGVSYLVARVPEAQTDSFNIHVWFSGREPTANNQHGVIYPVPFVFFTGVHLAGPVLTPHTWQAGLFSYPPTGGAAEGHKTSAMTSFGNHGYWPFTDYLAYDDVAEIWWDPTATGPDEVGNEGVGMYQYVNGGQRFLPGQHPASEPFVFNRQGAVTLYNERPANERAPSYPSPRDSGGS